MFQGMTMEISNFSLSSTSNPFPLFKTHAPILDSCRRFQLQTRHAQSTSSSSHDHYHKLLLPPLEGFKPIDQVDEAGFSWANEKYNNVQRTFDIWSFIVGLRIRITLHNDKWTYLGRFSEENQRMRRKKSAIWVREKLLQLGPTFIKLGQLSSTRSDLFPKEFTDELAKLQDRVPAISPHKARNLIERELGGSVDELFMEFEDVPIAAASLGQVHRAVLYNGEKVVVKVQRPGLKRLFDIDMRNMKLVAEWFQKSQTFGGPNRDWIGVYEECAKILYQEIDYINEGKNADRFRRDFRNISWVRVPMVFWDYTATKILTQEYVPGVKINDLDVLDSRGYNRSLISSRAVEAYLIQIMRNGFFHADPHPGNLAVDVEGALIYYDFGMMGEIKPCTRERLLQLFNAAYDKDDQKVIEVLIDLGVLQPTGDLLSVRRSVHVLLESVLSQRPDQQLTLATLGEDLFAVTQKDKPLRYPSSFTFVIRAFSALEGIGHTLDPNFSFLKIATPYFQELFEVRHNQHIGTQVVHQITRRVRNAKSSTLSMPRRVRRIEEFVEQLEYGDLKLCVRVLESERATRKEVALQMATMYGVIGGTLVNFGVNFGTHGSELVANGSFVGAGVFLALFVTSMQRARNI